MADAGTGDSIAGSLPSDSVLNPCPQVSHKRDHLSAEQKAQTTKLAVIKGFLAIF